MTAFASQISPTSPGFVQNHADNLALLDQMRSLEARATAKSDQRRAVFDKRGQLSPRQRLAALLDPDMPFVELCNMANYLVDDPDPATSIPGASVILGIGYVSGVRALVFVDDAGINAGASTTKTVDKVLACLAIAMKQKLPLVHLVESAGANLMSYTVELWAHGGGLFAGLARLSAAGIPVVTILHGASTAGGAYQPGLSDYVIGVKNNGMAMLAGSALVQAATGERAADSDLGSAEMHASTTGLVDYLAENDAHAIEIARDVIADLNWNANTALPPSPAYEPPHFSPDEITGIVPTDYRKPYDMRELAARLVDGSRLRDFKPGHGPATLCLQASVHGYPIGIIANNGPIDPAGATKVTHFLQLLDQSTTPAIFLNNTTGYMVGLDAEHGGMIKHGAKMIQAVTNLRSPKLSFYVGASFGAGNYGMCGFAFDPDFLFTWPNAKTGVMGGEQAASTMEQIALRTAHRKGTQPDPDQLATQRAEITAHFDRQSDAFFTSGRMLDHGMIDPRDTRHIIAFCLQTCREARARILHPNSFGVARP